MENHSFNKALFIGGTRRDVYKRRNENSMTTFKFRINILRKEKNSKPKLSASMPPSFLICDLDRNK